MKQPISSKSAVFMIILFAIAGFSVIRIATLEDSWICKNGEWIKHGNPSAQKPSTLCPVNNGQTNKTNQITVYFNNEKLAGNNNDCGLVYGVQRNLSTPIDYKTILNELFKGPSADEKAQGYTSMFSSNTASILKNVKVVDNKVYVDLNDLRLIIPNASTSCGSQSFLSQIEETLKHDKKINEVFFAINGDPQVFYDWIQIGCDKKLNNCDKSPFQD